MFLFREVFSAMADVGGWPALGPAPTRLAQLTEADLERYAGDHRIDGGIGLPLLRTWIDGRRVCW